MVVKDVQELNSQAVSILREIGYDVDQIPVTLNGRIKRVMGRYFRKEKRIELQKTYFEKASVDDVINVLLHEYAHHLSPTYGHGEDWLAIAKHISDNTEYEIQQYAPKEKTEFSDWKYKVGCSCGREWKYYRQTDLIRCVKNHKDGYTCVCGNTSEVFTLIENL